MSPKGDFLEGLQADIEKVNYCLMENLRSHIPLIAEVNQHILTGGGKRLRSLLFVICARLCGYEGSGPIPFLPFSNICTRPPCCTMT